VPTFIVELLAHQFVDFAVIPEEHWHGPVFLCRVPEHQPMHQLSSRLDASVRLCSVGQRGAVFPPKVKFTAHGLKVSALSNYPQGVARVMTCTHEACSSGLGKGADICASRKER
jgi:hypothetical protein